MNNVFGVESSTIDQRKWKICMWNYCVYYLLVQIDINIMFFSYSMNAMSGVGCRMDTWRSVDLSHFSVTYPNTSSLSVTDQVAVVPSILTVQSGLQILVWELSYKQKEPRFPYMGSEELWLFILLLLLLLLLLLSISICYCKMSNGTACGRSVAGATLHVLIIKKILNPTCIWAHSYQ